MKKTKIFLFSIFGLMFITAGTLSFSSSDNAQAASPFSLDEQTAMEEVQQDAYGDSGDPQDIRAVVANIVQIVLEFLAIIFLVLVVWSGFEWMTAGGNQEKIDQAKKRLRNSIIGLAIVLMAYGITYFVLDQLTQAVSDDAWP